MAAREPMFTRLRKAWSAWLDYPGQTERLIAALYVVSYKLEGPEEHGIDFNIHIRDEMLFQRRPSAMLDASLLMARHPDQ